MIIAYIGFLRVRQQKPLEPPLSPTAPTPTAGDEPFVVISTLAKQLAVFSERNLRLQDENSQLLHDLNECREQLRGL